MEELEISLFYLAGYQRVDICGRNRLMFCYMFEKCKQCIPDEKNQHCGGDVLPMTIYVRREDIKRDSTPSIGSKL